MSYLCDLPIEDCVGKGTGLDDQQLLQKIEILKSAKNFHRQPKWHPRNISNFCRLWDGSNVWSYAWAYANNMIILVDGFIASSVFLVAQKLSQHKR